MKAGVIGIGHVGASTALSLLHFEEIGLYDINPEPINDFFNNKHLVLKSIPAKDYVEIEWDKFKPYYGSTLEFSTFVQNTDIFFICLPTDLGETQRLDVVSIIDTLGLIVQIKKPTTTLKTPIIIRSTLNIGDCNFLSSLYQNLEIIYMPEFLTEGNEYRDTMNPSRIVVGLQNSHDFEFIDRIYCLFQYDKKASNIFFVSYKEAETIKLASNCYLAMRLAFFNEVAHFVKEGLVGNVKNIIDGICSDERIGNYYNNPSFGYGGYCLPKDTIAFKTCLNETYPLINIVPLSNTRHIQRTVAFIRDLANKHFINKGTKPTIGFYSFEYKKGIKSTRESSLANIFDLAVSSNINAYLVTFNKFIEIEEFKNKCDLILMNRYDRLFDDVKDKIYTYDVYPGRTLV